MHIKTTRRHHLAAVRMTTIKNKIRTKNTRGKCWQGRKEREPLGIGGNINQVIYCRKPYRECGTTENLFHCWWERRMVQPLWSRIWLILIKLNTILSYVPEPYTQLIWKLLSTQKWACECYFTHNCPKPKAAKMPCMCGNNLWHIHRVEYSSAIKKNKLSGNVMVDMDKS